MEEIKCEHIWESLGITGLSWIDEQGGGYVDKTYRQIVGAIFCKKCGEIKEKSLL